MSTRTRRSFLRTLPLAAAASRVVSSQVPPRVRTIAGIGTAGAGPDEGDAPLTPLSNPYGVVIGPDGALYFCDLDTARIRRIDLKTGRITTVAGNGRPGFSGDGGPATAASLKTPHEVRFDSDGNMYVVERDNHCVRRIDRRTRVITTTAGSGTPGFSGDGGPALKAQLRQPHSIAFDSSGNLLICDIGNHRIRIVDSKTGGISTYAGTGERLRAPDEASLDNVALNGPRSIDTDGAGRIYLVLREGNAVFAIDERTRRIRRIAGTGETGFTGDNGPALEARFSGPKGIACTPDGDVLIVDTENHAIRMIDARSQRITTLIGTGERGDGPDGDPRLCKLARPHGVFFHQGRIYVGDSENHRVRVWG